MTVSRRRGLSVSWSSRCAILAICVCLAVGVAFVIVVVGLTVPTCFALGAVAVVVGGGGRGGGGGGGGVVVYIVAVRLVAAFAVREHRPHHDLC